MFNTENRRLRIGRTNFGHIASYYITDSYEEFICVLAKLTGNIFQDDSTIYAHITRSMLNHSCEPNCRFEGLDVVAIKPVAVGEELTLDYAMFLDSSAEPFDCQCGAATCRGRIQGTPGNSVSARAKAASEITQ